MRTLRRSLASCLSFVLAGLGFSAPTSAQGRIFVAHDEWTLSDNGFAANSASTQQFVRNVADWFTGGQPGAFRVWSNDFGFTGGQLGQVMTTAGHTWTVSTSGTFDLATLQQYDAVFVGVYTTGVDANVLTQYVQSGGCVYICGGSGGDGLASLAWNPFLHNFGLGFAANYNGLSGVRSITSLHPLFAGVSTLYENNGNSVGLAGQLNANAQVLQAAATQGLYAIYDGGLAPTAYCTAKVNSLGCAPAIDSSGAASVSSASAFSVRAVNVLNQKQGLLFYGYGQQAAPFQGGWLCVATPTRRTPAQNSGGSSAPTNNCSGVYSFDFNAWAQSGFDPLLVAGQTVFAQYWSRDPASPSTTGLTNALRFVMGA